VVSIERESNYAFFAAFNLAHRARWAAAIFFRPAADMVRFSRAGESPRVSALAFAHRALCAAAILARPAADIFLRPSPAF
jgi:hypothetical protein